jgi:acyl dehydratase
MSKFELRPGLRFTRNFKVDWWRVLLIALATGDFQPLHFWSWFGKLTRFKKGPIAHGVLISSFPVTIAGMDIVPKESRFHYVVIFGRALQTEYLAPVFYGERLFVVVEVLQLNADDAENDRTIAKGWARLSWNIYKEQDDGLISEAVATGGYLIKIDQVRNPPRSVVKAWATSFAADLFFMRRRKRVANP